MMGNLNLIFYYYYYYSINMNAAHVKRKNNSKKRYSTKMCNIQNLSQNFIYTGSSVK